MPKTPAILARLASRDSKIRDSYIRALIAQFRVEEDLVEKKSLRAALCRLIFHAQRHRTPKLRQAWEAYFSRDRTAELVQEQAALDQWEKDHPVRKTVQVRRGSSARSSAINPRTPPWLK